MGSDLCLFQLSLPAGCIEKFVLILRDLFIFLDQRLVKTSVKFVH